MENKETISDDIKKLSVKNIVKVRQLPEFPLCKSIEEGRTLLTSVIKLVDLTIINFKWLPEYDNIVEWMVSPKRKGLNLAGDPGRLKTVISTLVFPVLFYHLHKLTVRPVDAKDINTSYDIFNSSPVIVIDDYGTEDPVNNYGIKSEPLCNLADFCEKRSKLLIMTTNMSSKNVSLRYGIRTIERFDVLCRNVKFSGDSFR